MRYHEPLFRPPSEWDSLIIQVTHGCSWNGCHFCDMYKDKRFSVRSMAALGRELKTWEGDREALRIRRIFLADGNASVLSFDQLKERLVFLKRLFPRLRRVSMYASPRDLVGKGEDELASLRELGLTRLYVGIESGDDPVLRQNNKGETRDSTLTGALRAQAAGMDLSVMILLGLGGRERSVDHIRASADLINRIQPYQLSLLVLGYPRGLAVYRQRLENPFTPLSLKELLREMNGLLERLSLHRTHFRCDHGSNFLPLQGVLGRDKKALLALVDEFDRTVPDSVEPYLPMIG